MKAAGLPCGEKTERTKIDEEDGDKAEEMTTKQRRRPRKTSGQEDRQEGGAGGGRRNYGAGTSPAGALAHDPAVIRRGVPFALALKTGGRGRGIFFSPLLHWSRCPYVGKPLSSWGAVLYTHGMWHDKSTDK